MTWWVKVDQDWQSCDHLRVEEIAEIEAQTGQAWAFMSPMASIPVAIALFSTFLMRPKDDGGQGLSVEEATLTVNNMTVGHIKNRFRYREDDDLPGDWEDGLPVVDPKPEEGSGTAT